MHTSFLEYDVSYKTILRHRNEGKQVYISGEQWWLFYSLRSSRSIYQNSADCFTHWEGVDLYIPGEQCWLFHPMRRSTSTYLENSADYFIHWEVHLHTYPLKRSRPTYLENRADYFIHWEVGPIPGEQCSFIHWGKVHIPEEQCWLFYPLRRSKSPTGTASVVSVQESGE